MGKILDAHKYDANAALVYWAWLAVDDDDKPTAVVTVTRSFVEPEGWSDDPLPARAVIGIVYSTARGQGAFLVSHARQTLQEQEGLTLFASGYATQRGGRLMGRLNIEIDPGARRKMNEYPDKLRRWQTKNSNRDWTDAPLPPIRPYDPADAEEAGRKALAEAAYKLNLEVPEPRL